MAASSPHPAGTIMSRERPGAAGPVRPSDDTGVRARFSAILRSGRALRHLVRRWGALTYAREPIEARLRGLTLGKRLEEARLPLAIVATDLLSGRRVVPTTGPTAEATYASSALAGILPPARYANALLADGCYSDVAPVDVARGLGCEIAPSFATPMDTLDFGRLRAAIAAGARAVRTKRRALTELLRAADPTQPPDAAVIDVTRPDRRGRVGS